MSAEATIGLWQLALLVITLIVLVLTLVVLVFTLRDIKTTLRRVTEHAELLRKQVFGVVYDKHKLRIYNSIYPRRRNIQ